MKNISYVSYIIRHINYRSLLPPSLAIRNYVISMYVTSMLSHVIKFIFKRYLI